MKTNIKNNTELFRARYNGETVAKPFLYAYIYTTPGYKKYCYYRKMLEWKNAAKFVRDVFGKRLTKGEYFER